MLKSLTAISLAFILSACGDKEVEDTSSEVETNTEEEGSEASEEETSEESEEEGE
jgi:hypothetical protein